MFNGTSRTKARRKDRQLSLVVLRVRNGNGQLALSKPCLHCSRHIRLHHPWLKRVVYSVNASVHDSANASVQDSVVNHSANHHHLVQEPTRGLDNGPRQLKGAKIQK